MKHNKVHVQKKYDERIVNHIVLWFQCAHELAQPCQSHTISVSGRASRSQFVHTFDRIQCGPMSGGSHVATSRRESHQINGSDAFPCAVSFSFRYTQSQASQRKDKMEWNDEKNNTAKTNITDEMCRHLFRVLCECRLRVRHEPRVRDTAPYIYRLRWYFFSSVSFNLHSSHEYSHSHTHCRHMWTTEKWVRKKRERAHWASTITLIEWIHLNWSILWEFVTHSVIDCVAVDSRTAYIRAAMGM